MHEWGLSLVGLRGVEEIEALAAQEPELLFELSYRMRQEELDALHPVLEHRVLSLHATCPHSRFFPNFASDDPSVLARSMHDMHQSMLMARRFHASILVLHPGYLCEEAMPSDNAARLALLSKPMFQRHVAVKEGSICDREYVHSDEYRRAMDRLERHIAEVARMCGDEGIALAVENLNPRSGYLCMTQEDFVRLSQVPHLRFCLDVGHLWIAHHAFHFDFFAAMRGMLATGKVVTCHLHANPCDGTIWIDRHGDLDAFPLFPIREILHVIASAPVNCILETVDHPRHNISVFKQFLSER